eukprot:1189126-Prorocentrum_minimum.AAC.4
MYSELDIPPEARMRPTLLKSESVEIRGVHAALQCALAEVGLVRSPPQRCQQQCLHIWPDSLIRARSSKFMRKLVSVLSVPKRFGAGVPWLGAGVSWLGAGVPWLGVGVPWLGPGVSWLGAGYPGLVLGYPGLVLGYPGLVSSRSAAR